MELYELFDSISCFLVLDVKRLGYESKVEEIISILRKQQEEYKTVKQLKDEGVNLSDIKNLLLRRYCYIYHYVPQ